MPRLYLAAYAMCEAGRIHCASHRVRLSVLCVLYRLSEPSGGQTAGKD